MSLSACYCAPAVLFSDCPPHCMEPAYWHSTEPQGLPARNQNPIVPTWVQFLIPIAFGLIAASFPVPQSKYTNSLKVMGFWKKKFVKEKCFLLGSVERENEQWLHCTMRICFAAPSKCQYCTSKANTFCVFCQARDYLLKQVFISGHMRAHPTKVCGHCSLYLAQRTALVVMCKAAARIMSFTTKEGVASKLLKNHCQ